MRNQALKQGWVHPRCFCVWSTVVAGALVVAVGGYALAYVRVRHFYSSPSMPAQCFYSITIHYEELWPTDKTEKGSFFYLRHYCADSRFAFPPSIAEQNTFTCINDGERLHGFFYRGGTCYPGDYTGLYLLFIPAEHAEIYLRCP